MASKKCSLIFVVLVFCMLSFSSNILARNIADASELYAFSDEKSMNKRLLLQQKRLPPCKSRRNQEERDNPGCHNY
ncbi:hypothetical protein MtrunA17_Chr4g0018971 [Medicago truncatula]|uniref:RALF-like protein n=1 Tax=Medicago truncatula TaxID=3880 RepID=A0A072U7Z9_MEDTR|nr:RALF-like protein [Medicago truncatula]KEH29456.1 RALF-like protein [Medicago truncatula]RHN59877.1 hypothetical protein MtrunA17_Chr4g0018971 [Medicago truncatula]